MFDDIHDTFARDITIFRNGKTTLISIDHDYNYLYGRKKDDNKTSPELEKYTTKARIKYFGEQEKNAVIGKDANINYSFPNADIRLKVDATAYALIKEAEKIEVDGFIYELTSEPSRTGPFGTNYYVVYLKRGV